ncbi:hypothetical protein HZ994_09090 [Akkermansiaceae bacterium]|nr:hypothetical protein HZ994_09090 [Akkermansiaceae bacterium]
MIPIPNPLHPALVHFPIVLILIGTAVAVAAVFVRRWHLPWLAAGLLLGGAAGAMAATWSGEEEDEGLGKLSPHAEQVLDEHEEWGERTRNLAIIAGLLAAGAVVMLRKNKISRGLGVAAALVALAASYAVAETGHYGGQLVYRHGVGVSASGSSAPDANRRDDD